MNLTFNKWKGNLLEQDFDKSVLMIKDKLNSTIWTRGKLSDEVSERLLEIANDFYSSIQEGIPEAPDIEDITFTGSLASYNYHSMSDIDLHILVDYSRIGKSQEILSELFAMKRIQWNRTHDIMILGHEVEIYIQDTNEPHEANGVFSIQNGEWIEMPVRERVDIDYHAIEKKYKAISLEISELAKLFRVTEYEKVYKHASKLKEKIKNMRNSGLKDEGIHSAENLAFKMLRLNGNIEELTSLRHSSYDMMMTIPNDANASKDISENWWKYLKNSD